MSQGRKLSQSPDLTKLYSGFLYNHYLQYQDIGGVIGLVDSLPRCVVKSYLYGQAVENVRENRGLKYSKIEVLVVVPNDRLGAVSKDFEDISGASAAIMHFENRDFKVKKIPRPDDDEGHVRRYELKPCPPIVERVLALLSGGPKPIYLTLVTERDFPDLVV
jgi:hypothetical protein